jgi:NADH dehydrogenase
LLVTGANGHLGRRLLPLVADRFAVTAVVRSERARTTLEKVLAPGNARVEVIDYQDVAGLSGAISGCAAVVHLVGILKEARDSRYQEAHEGATRALLDALGPAVHSTRFVYLSILGAHPASTNRCLASKGRAERMLLETAPESVVVQVPMVLGEGDYAAGALARSARSRIGLSFRSASREQPVYAGDVVAAIAAALQVPGVAGEILRLAGPESLTRAALIQRAARHLGNSVTTVSLPYFLGRGLAWMMERLLANPPVTPAMLEVLDHDDDIDPSAACAALNLELTPLDEILGRCVATD